MTKPIRQALAGAGLFARDAHVPTEPLSTVEVVAVYSPPAKAPAEACKPADHPFENLHDLDLMLHARRGSGRPDSADEQLPEASRRRWAGKLVLKWRKPVAPDVAIGRRLLQFARAYPRSCGWWRERPLRVRLPPAPENWFAPEPSDWRSWQAGCADLGQADIKYYHTAGGAPARPGGFLLDGVCITRLSAGGRCEKRRISAESSSCAKTCRPADTERVTAFRQRHRPAAINRNLRPGAPFAPPSKSFVKAERAPSDMTCSNLR